MTTSLFLIAAANAQLANALPGSENSPNERRRVAPISKVKFALPSATYGVDHHVVRVMKDSKAGTVITCALGNDSATKLFGVIHGFAIGRTTKSVWSCVTGTNQLIDLAMAEVGNLDTETSKRINPETGEEEPDDDYDYQQIIFDMFNIGGGIGPSVPPSVCIVECNSRFSPFYARCRQMGHPAVVETCMAFVAAAHAACISACYM